MAGGKRKATPDAARSRDRGHPGARRATERNDAPDELAPSPGTTQPSAASSTPEPSAPRRRTHGLDKPEVTSVEIGSKVHKVVPEPQPLDVDGIRTMTVGSLLWLAAFLGLLPFIGTLQRNGDVWWLWTCLAGFGLGLIGVEYCRRRKVSLERDDDADS